MSNLNPGPIKRPKQNIDYTGRANDTFRIHREPISGKYGPDRRQTLQKKVRLDYEADSNPLASNPIFQIQSPDDPYIAIDSADQISQEYTISPSGGSSGHQLGRVFIDRANMVMVTYHYNRLTTQWIRLTTRLDKNTPLPTPPVNQMVHSADYTFGSRGRRYVRNKTKLSIKSHRTESISNRIYDNQSGTSGERGTTGEFRPF